MQIFRLPSTSTSSNRTGMWDQRFARVVYWAIATNVILCITLGTLVAQGFSVYFPVPGISCSRTTQQPSHLFSSFLERSTQTQDGLTLLRRPKAGTTCSASFWSSSSLLAPRTTTTLLAVGSNTNEISPLQPGSTVALVTPFDSVTGAVNYEELRRLLQWHVKAGTNNLCILGTTGEASMLTSDERRLVLQVAVEEVKGVLPILVGTGAIPSSQVQEWTQQAADLGCDASLVVTPYYVKPPQRGLIQHYLTLANTSNGLPIVMYNVPGRTGVDMSDESIALCAQHEQIIGIKDATGSLARLTYLQNLLQQQQQQPASQQQQFQLWSGDDATMVDYCLQGGYGCISVTANVAPTQVRQLMDYARAGVAGFSSSPEAIAAYALNDKLMGLHQHLFCEANPIPTKWALTQPIVRTMTATRGSIGTTTTTTTTTEPILSSDYCRPPLASLDPQYRPLLERVLRQAELLPVLPNAQDEK